MDLKFLPSPHALKNIFVAHGINTLLGGCRYEDETDETDWELEYDKKKEEYTFFQQQDSDNHYLTFVYNNRFCYLLGNCAETGRQLPEEAQNRMPEEIWNTLKDNYMLCCCTFLIWSVDGVHWQQLEEYEEDSPFGTVLGDFLRDGDFADPDDGAFQAASPVLYQLYKQHPFDDEMLLEFYGERTESEKINKMRLPKVNPETTEKKLKTLGYPCSFTKDYQVTVSPEYTDILIEKKFYFLATYCLGKLLDKQPDDKELLRKAADTCYAAKMYPAAIRLYAKIGEKDPALYLNAARLYQNNDELEQAVKYYILGFEAQDASYMPYLELAKEMSKTGWRGTESAMPLYEKVLQLEPDCHEANYALFTNLVDEKDTEEYMTDDDDWDDDDEEDENTEEADISGDGDAEEDGENADQLLAYFDKCDPARLKQSDYARLSEWLLRKRQFEKAHTYISAGKKLKNDHYFTYLLADCLVHLKRYDEAIELYESTRFRPVLDYNWNNEYETWEPIGSYRKELEELKRMISQGGDLAKAYYQAGKEYKQKGAYLRAQYCFDKATLLNPQYHGKAYYLFEDDDEFYEKAVESKEGCIDLFKYCMEEDEDISWKFVVQAVKNLKNKYPEDIVEINLELIASMITSIQDIDKKFLKALIKETVENGYDGIFDSSFRECHKLVKYLADLGYDELALKNIDFYQECSAPYPHIIDNQAIETVRKKIEKKKKK
ncbi:MAG: CDC27 family protein [Parabacteroides sp.]|nr:CDC27 family protein [Parabacteroides sp.]